MYQYFPEKYPMISLVLANLVFCSLHLGRPPYRYLRTIYVTFKGLSTRSISGRRLASGIFFKLPVPGPKTAKLKTSTFRRISFTNPRVILIEVADSNPNFLLVHTLASPYLISGWCGVLYLTTSGVSGQLQRRLGRKDVTLSLIE